MVSLKFYIILEQANKGYIVDSKPTLEEAVEIHDKICEMAFNCAYDDNLMPSMQYIDSYPINGSETSIGNVELSSSNGYIHVSIIKTESMTSSYINRLKLERANLSSVFDHIEVSESLDRLVDMFPNIPMISN